ncbi:hypothetical protein Lal_00036945 [Lupinus albus]|nr:hypothetical protein Lal_00036945 [Lupinus albus]
MVMCNFLNVVDGDHDIGVCRIPSMRQIDRCRILRMRDSCGIINCFIGMQFESKDAIINAIKQFHIKNYVDYIVVESRPDRYVGQCKYFGSGCQWRIRASLNGKRYLWEIRKINGTHTCVSTSISQDHTKLNSSFIANCIIHLVSEDPGILVKALVKEIVTRFGYTITYRKACTAKQIAMSQIYVRKMVIDEYFLLHLPLSKEKLKKHESGFSQWFNAHSVYCIRHVASNFNKEFKDGDLKEKVIQMRYELMRPRFERMLDDLRQKNPRAAAWLDNIPK